MAPNEFVDTLWLYSSLIFPKKRLTGKCLCPQLWRVYKCTDPLEPSQKPKPYLLQWFLSSLKHQNVACAVELLHLISHTVFEKFQNQAGQSSTVSTSVSSCW